MLSIYHTQGINMQYVLSTLSRTCSRSMFFITVSQCILYHHQIMTLQYVLYHNQSMTKQNVP